MTTTAARRLATGILVAGALATLAGCGSGGTGDATAGSTTSGAAREATTAPPASTSAPASQDPTTSEPSTSSPLAPEDDVTQLQFRPVVGIGAPVDTTTTTVVDGGGGLVAPSADGATTYTLGPIGFDGTGLRSAKAALYDSWVVEVEVTDDTLRAANELFNACYEATATCPDLTGGGHGAIAVVLLGEVISAPVVNGPDLASDAFVISGDFTRAEAEHIADLISS